MCRQPPADYPRGTYPRHVAVLIRLIDVSDHVRSKISGLHDLMEDDVIDACERYVIASWEDDPERGRRLLITGPTSHGRVIRVVLYAVDEESGHYRLATAF
jgi:hypothetical protein